MENAAEKDALLHGLGINVNLAPVVDVSTNPGDFIYDRTFGLDADGTSDCVTAVVEQMSADNMGSVLTSPWTSGRWSSLNPPTSSPSPPEWTQGTERPPCWYPTTS